MKKVAGHLIDIHAREIFPAELEIQSGKIVAVKRLEQAPDRYLLPGFIDAHVHVESSMLVPSEFARLAVVHGTVATISDPHEIGNVLGVKGVEYMLDNAKEVDFKFYFGAPSCVPATPFETAGAEISAEDIAYLLSKPEVTYLAEMMNWPGVLAQDATVMEKIAVAQQLGKPIDGHAPGLKGKQAEDYAAIGISTDHECFTAQEALGKLKAGMKILIREGSAAKNFDALAPLIPDHHQSMMFCSDDKHPDNLVEGHIDQLVKRALAMGMDLFDVLQVACANPVEHYKMNVGLLRKGDPADFIVIDHPDNFNVLQTWIEGRLMAENGKTHIAPVSVQVPNKFEVSPKQKEDFYLKPSGSKVRVMQALDGQLITGMESFDAQEIDNADQTNVEKDILKIAVVNRYHDADVAVGFIQQIGLKKGAIASSVGHDSHNIVVVGVDDDSICRAVNAIISHKGGVAAVCDGEERVLPLPVAGIMSNRDGYEVAAAYSAIDAMAKSMGSSLASPFMTLSFMALLVIPRAKMSDKGLFDGERFEFIDVFHD